MPNYYEILGVAPHVTQHTIKRAFRRLVKTYHPDVNPSKPQWAAAKFKAIHEAYRNLSDDVRRLAYDRLLFGGPAPTPAEYASIHDRLQRDTAYQAEHILTDLLDGHGKRAVQTYERLHREVREFDLIHFMSLKDYLDTKFLLAEQYHAQGQARKALEFYLEVYREECEGPRLRYFFDEVCERIIAIYCSDLARNVDIEEAIRCYKKAAKIHQPNSARARIFKKMAERYLDDHDYENAYQMMHRAFETYPKMKGARRICEKLGIPCPPHGASQPAPVAQDAPVDNVAVGR